MGLMNLLGVNHRDLFDGDTLVVHMQKRDAARKPKRLSEADSYIAQCVAEQRVREAEDRLAMLERVQAKLQDADGERRSRLEYLEVQLYPKKPLPLGDDDE